MNNDRFTINEGDFEIESEGEGPTLAELEEQQKEARRAEKLDKAAEIANRAGRQKTH